MARVTETTKKSEPLGVRIAQGINSGLSMAKNISDWQSKLQELDMQKQQTQLNMEYQQTIMGQMKYKQGIDLMDKISEYPSAERSTLVEHLGPMIEDNFRQAGATNLPAGALKDTLLKMGDVAASKIKTLSIMNGMLFKAKQDPMSLTDEQIASLGEGLTATYGDLIPVARKELQPVYKKMYDESQKALQALTAQRKESKAVIAAGLGGATSPEEVAAHKNAGEKFNRSTGRWELPKKAAGQGQGAKQQYDQMMTDAENQFNDLLKLLDQSTTAGDWEGKVARGGPVWGRLGNVLNKVGASPQLDAELRSRMSGIALSYTRATQGSRPSDFDLEFIKAYVIPQQVDSATQKQGKLKALKRLFDAYHKTKGTKNREDLFKVAGFGKQYEEFAKKNWSSWVENNPAQVSNFDTQQSVKELTDAIQNNQGNQAVYEGLD